MTSSFIEKVLIISIVVICIMALGFAMFGFLYPRFAGNKTAIDLKYTFNKAITSINGEKLEIDIDTWADYEGEQIQVISKDGKVYLLSSFNTILVKE